MADIELQEPGVYGPMAPDSAELERAAALIGKSQRVAIWAGGGAVWSRASEALTRLAEHLQAPVITTPEGKGAIDPRHYLSLGTCRGGVNPASDPMRKYISEECDLVLAVGTRFLVSALWIRPSRCCRLMLTLRRLGATIRTPSPCWATLGCRWRGCTTC